MIDQVMEPFKSNVRVIKDSQQYVFADNVAGNLIALLPGAPAESSLSTAVNELGKNLLQASQDGNVEEIRSLLAKGAPFTADWLGTSPLHLAALNNHIEVCEIFLRAGMCKDTRTKVDRTPLHMAAFEGNADIVECLLRHGADVDAKDMLQMTPLHWAAQNGHSEIAASLIRNGASTTAVNKFDLTPMDIALQTNRSDIIEVINFTIRDPLQAITQLTELNESTDAVEPILQLNMQSEDVSAPASDLPLEAGLLSNDDSQEYMQPCAEIEADAETQDDMEEVQYVEAIEEEEGGNTTFTESMKFLQQHGITMLQDDESNILSSVMETGHSVVLTEAGKQALNSIKAEKLLAEAAIAPTKGKVAVTIAGQQQPALKKRKIITVTADQFLAMTSNNSNSLRIVNGKVVQDAPQAHVADARRAPSRGGGKMAQNVRPEMKNEVVVSETETELVKQLAKARALAEAYRKRLVKTELELQKYKQKCKLLMEQSGLSII